MWPSCSETSSTDKGSLYPRIWQPCWNSHGQTASYSCQVPLQVYKRPSAMDKVNTQDPSGQKRETVTIHIRSTQHTAAARRLFSFEVNVVQSVITCSVLCYGHCFEFRVVFNLHKGIYISSGCALYKLMHPRKQSGDILIFLMLLVT